jgi:DNA processing protein
MLYQSPQKAVKEVSWDANRLGWLLLAWFDGFGARTLRKLAKQFGNDGHAAAQVSPQELEKIGHKQKVIRRFLEFRAATDAETLATQLEQESIEFILSQDASTPNLLRQSSDPPFALFLRGAPIPTIDLAAVVGTRDMTAYGRQVAAQLSMELARAGIGIASGLAMGIDAAAHQGTLDAHGYTIGVLGTGVDERSIYPRHNLKLAHHILESGGTLLSEFPPGTEGLKHHFPLRNRLIASLAKATVVVEAAESSGSLITAHLALAENRDVFAVPGPISSPQSAGTNRLLAKGAIPCLSASDILDNLGAAKPTQTSSPALRIELSDKERNILKQLTAPMHIDDLSRRMNMPIIELSALLTQLELHSVLTQESGKICAKIPLPAMADD